MRCALGSNASGLPVIETGEPGELWPKGMPVVRPSEARKCLWCSQERGFGAKRRKGALGQRKETPVYDRKAAPRTRRNAAKTALALPDHPSCAAQTHFAFAKDNDLTSIAEGATICITRAFSTRRRNQNLVHRSNRQLTGHSRFKNWPVRSQEKSHLARIGAWHFLSFFNFHWYTCDFFCASLLYTCNNFMFAHTL